MSQRTDVGGLRSEIRKKEKGKSMLTVEDIKALNIEISSRCIGSCPFCSRQQKVRPYGRHDITFKDFKSLPEEMLKRLERISFAGNFGDFCSNAEFADIVAYAKEKNPDLLMDGDTNGSMQDEIWWKRLGPFFKNGSMLIFALDGLEDTHPIHRRGTTFRNIIKNIEAFTASGGAAYWKFIVFEHNEHQINAAEALAKDIGCTGFLAVSSRDYDHVFRKPQTIDVQIKRDMYHQNWASLSGEDRYAQCKPFASGSIYIAADGTVHPCCFAHCMYITEHNDWFGYIVPLIQAYRAEINFKTRPLQEILGHAYFEEVLKKSRTNDYCILKCNRHKKHIRQKLILHEKRFH
jgi:MoaA/NifB/PqqE/SkfB family radical SAM enzyme